MGKAPPLDQRFEDFAVRVMYLLTTLDTFVIFGALPAALLFGMNWRSPLSWSSLVIVYIFFRVARFFPSVLLGIPVYLGLLISSGAITPRIYLLTLGLLFAIATGIQALMQGLPHLLASRDPTVPVRMWINSLWTIAPTTLSLPVSVGFGSLLACAGIAGDSAFSSIWGWLFLATLATACLLARHHAPRTFIPAATRPETPIPHRCKRVILLNIDGLSHRMCEKASMPFIKKLSSEYTYVEGGAITVCRALTNPAFASILTGAPPKIHGIRNNNLGQSIRIEALPDIVPTKLYGSMHVKHFSKPRWDVSVFSLVRDGAFEVETQLFEKLRGDILEHPEIRLFIADISAVDFIGHSYGHYSKQYLHAASTVDAMIAEFWRWLEAQGLLEETSVIISSDHGLFAVEHSYLISRTEKFVPLVFAGKNIGKGMIIRNPASIMDINACISYLLGERYCENSEGSVLDPGLIQS